MTNHSLDVGDQSDSSDHVIKQESYCGIGNVFSNDRTLAYFYLSTWFTLNVIITLYSKAYVFWTVFGLVQSLHCIIPSLFTLYFSSVFSIYKFPYPMSMTCVHMIFTSIGVQLCASFGLVGSKSIIFNDWMGYIIVGQFGHPTSSVENTH